MKTIILSAVFMFSCLIFPQKYMERQLAGNIPADQLVSLASTISFNQAIELLNKVSLKTTGKKIVSTVQSEDPIGIELNNMAYDKALIILVQMKGMTIEQTEDVTVVKRKSEAEVKTERTSDNYAPVSEREVKISAVFFEGDVSNEKQRGISWNVLFSKKGLSTGGGTGNTQAGNTEDGAYNFSATSSFDMGGFFGDATAVFRFLENENLGEIIASPNITTRDRKKGRIQVGSDFSVKQRDFAGNIIENFFATGSIIEVTPYIYNEEGVDYILLDVKVERSSFVPGATTEVRKSSASSQVILLNGEETVIGGLFINEEKIVRSGVPILKDLPWWVFGLRYIFGSDNTTIAKKELVISIKAELVPTLKERFFVPREKAVIKNEIDRQREQIKLYQFNQQQADKENKNN